MPLCRELKEAPPGAAHHLGRLLPDPALRGLPASPSYVDYVVRGHGEVVFQSLLDASRRRRRSTGICRPGLPPAATGSHSPTHRADPAPERDCRSSRTTASTCDRYARSSFMGKRTLAHHSSYGCPFFCNFCAVVNMVGGRWLAQSAERTANVTRQLVEDWGADAIEFYDNNFFVHEARTAEFAERIMDLGHRLVGRGAHRHAAAILRPHLGADARQRPADGVHGRRVRLGRDAQAHEQGRHRVDREDAGDRRENARSTTSCPSSPSCSATRPTRRPTCDSTMEFIRKVKRVNPHTEIIMYVYTPVPLAGELYDAGQGRGLHVPRDARRVGQPTTGRTSPSAAARTIPWLADPIRRHMRDFERVLNAYYPTITDPNLRGARRISCARRAPGATTWASTATRWSCARCRDCWPISGRRRAASDARSRSPPHPAVATAATPSG